MDKIKILHTAHNKDAALFSKKDIYECVIIAFCIVGVFTFKVITIIPFHGGLGKNLWVFLFTPIPPVISAAIVYCCLWIWNWSVRNTQRKADAERKKGVMVEIKSPSKRLLKKRTRFLNTTSE